MIWRTNGDAKGRRNPKPSEGTLSGVTTGFGCRPATWLAKTLAVGRDLAGRRLGNSVARPFSTVRYRWRPHILDQLPGRNPSRSKKPRLHRPSSSRSCWRMLEPIAVRKELVTKAKEVLRVCEMKRQGMEVREEDVAERMNGRTTRYKGSERRNCVRVYQTPISQ